MTIPEFQAKYAAPLKMFTRTACFTAFMQTLESEHPVKKLKEKMDGDKLHGATMFLAQIDGFESCLELIRQIAAEAAPVVKEPEPNYADEEPAVS